MNSLFVIHAATTWCLIGLIWIIQVVHYPLFKNVGETHFVAYHERHMKLITWVVGPLMFIEVCSAGMLLLLGERSWLLIASLVPLAFIWLATAFVQVPLHGKLARDGYHTATIDRLVSTNKWRTLAWTVRGLCVATLLTSRIR